MTKALPQIKAILRRRMQDGSINYVAADCTMMAGELHAIIGKTGLRIRLLKNRTTNHPSFSVFQIHADTVDTRIEATTEGGLRLVRCRKTIIKRTRGVVAGLLGGFLWLSASGGAFGPNDQKCLSVGFPVTGASRCHAI